MKKQYIAKYDQNKINKLSRIFWDSSRKYTGDEIFNFINGKQKLDGVDINKTKARLLVSIRWYDLIDIFGLDVLKDFLSDEVLNNLWPKELKGKYLYVRSVLQELLR